MASEKWLPIEKTSKIIFLSIEINSNKRMKGVFLEEGAVKEN